MAVASDHAVGVLNVPFYLCWDRSLAKAFQYILIAGTNALFVIRSLELINFGALVSTGVPHDLSITLSESQTPAGYSSLPFTIVCLRMCYNICATSCGVKIH